MPLRLVRGVRALCSTTKPARVHVPRWLKLGPPGSKEELTVDLDDVFCVHTVNHMFSYALRIVSANKAHYTSIRYPDVTMRALDHAKLRQHLNARGSRE